MTAMNMGTFQNALLLITNPLRFSIPSLLSVVVPCVEKNLYIVFETLNAPNTTSNSSLNREERKRQIRPMVHMIYKQLTGKKLPSVDILLGNLDTIIRSTQPIRLPHMCQAVFTDCLSSRELYRYCQDHFKELDPNFELRLIDQQTSSDMEPLPTRAHNLFNETSTTQYDRGVLGGTFDRLHNGHKLLLTESALLCDSKIVVGITDGPMIKNKILSEVIEPVSHRISRVHSFINMIRPKIDVHCEPIEDPCGPSATMPDLNCIIVTDETEQGAFQVNEKRRENGLETLAVHVLPIIPADAENQDGDAKLSSTSLRREMLSILLKPPLRTAKANRPYIIGLTGGTGSGKSSIARRMAKLGAAIIDCDKLGHETYKVDTDAYKEIIKTFGEDIINPDDRTIQRRLLAAKVFQSPEELKKLTDIVWPAILKLAEQSINSFYEQGKRVIVMDAAVLIEAEWTAAVNEVWVASIPIKEAIRRTMERDKLTSEEAERRLKAQLSAEERFSHANVLLCTYWAESVTQTQVEHAWKLLIERINYSISNV